MFTRPHPYADAQPSAHNGKGKGKGRGKHKNQVRPKWVFECTTTDKVRWPPVHSQDCEPRREAIINHAKMKLPNDWTRLHRESGATDPTKFMKLLATGVFNDPCAFEEGCGEIDIKFPDKVSTHMYHYVADERAPDEWPADRVTHAVFKQRSGLDKIIVVRNVPQVLSID